MSNEANTKEKIPVKHIVGFAIAVILIIVAMVGTPPAGMEVGAFRVLMILLLGIALWVTEAFPVAVTAFLLLALIPLLNIMPLGGVMGAFANPGTVFGITVFALTVAMEGTSIPSRIIKAMLKMTGNNTKAIVFAFTIVCCILSAFLSNLAVTGIFMTLASSLLKQVDAPVGKSNLGKGLMMLVACGALFGGIGTPAGSSLNVTATFLMEQLTEGRFSVSFAQWTIVGMPACIVASIICWLFTMIFFPPEKISKEHFAEVMSDLEAKTSMPLNAWDYKALTIAIIMVVLWFLGSWVKVFDMTVVAIMGMVVMFLPGIRLIKSWEDFSAGVPWGIMMVFCCVNSVASAMLQSGGSQFVADLLANATGGLSKWTFCLVIGLLLIFIHAVFPVGPALVGILVGPLTLLAESTGHFSPAAAPIMIGFAFGAIYFMPLNMPHLMTYGFGYYTMTDCMKAGWIPSIIFGGVITGLWVPFCCGLIGI